MQRTNAATGQTVTEEVEVDDDGPDGETLPANEAGAVDDGNETPTGATGT